MYLQIIEVQIIIAPMVERFFIVNLLAECLEYSHPWRRKRARIHSWWL